MPVIESLKEIIRSYQSVVVAFSGGVDSAFVLKVTRDVLGPARVRAVTAKSDSLPESELAQAREFARAIDAQHDVIQTREFENPNYVQNPVNRCYFCKTELYQMLERVRERLNFQAICNGTNLDDLEDIRYGIAAAREHDVKSPLVEAGLRKADVRVLSRDLGLAVWDKPESPCLSSRIPHGDIVTREKLKQIEEGENFLREFGFREVRLRHFGNRARLELGKEEFIRAMDVRLRNEIVEGIRALGFKVIYFEPYQKGRLTRAAHKV